MVLARAVAEFHVAVAHQQVIFRWGDVDAAGLDDHAVLGLHCRKRPTTAEDRGQMARCKWWHMQDHEERGRQVRGQVPYELDKRLHPARRGANRYDGPLERGHGHPLLPQRSAEERVSFTVARTIPKLFSHAGDRCA
jgi:hypothetical protein